MSIFSQLSRFFGSPRVRHAAKGFTLVELLVVFAIMTLITALILFQHRRFDSSTLLRSLAYSIALSIRQSQVYGTSVRQFGSNFNYSYGVYFAAGFIVWTFCQ
jgi:prepilin-type N-terminal cleavage/methylation domain-containing protein